MLKKESASGPNGIREFLRQHPLYVVGPLFIATAIFLVLTFRPPPPPNAYYTIDDGVTFFVAPMQVAPFTYQGKQAVQALMYSSNGGASKFIGYLLRYTSNGKTRMEARLNDPKASMGPIPTDWTEVKKPGPGPWVPGAPMLAGPGAAPANGPTYQDVVSVSGPNGAPAFPVGAD